MKDGRLSTVHNIVTNTLVILVLDLYLLCKRKPSSTTQGHMHITQGHMLIILGHMFIILGHMHITQSHMLITWDIYVYKHKLDCTNPPPVHTNSIPGADPDIFQGGFSSV